MPRNSLSDSHDALLETPITALVVRPRADPGELASALVVDPRSPTLWWSSLDTWWSEAGAAHRQQLIYALARRLDDLDAVTARGRSSGVSPSRPPG